MTATRRGVASICMSAKPSRNLSSRAGTFPLHRGTSHAVQNVLAGSSTQHTSLGICFSASSTYGRHGFRLGLIVLANASRQDLGLNSWLLNTGNLLCIGGQFYASGQGSCTLCAQLALIYRQAKHGRCL